MKIEPTVLLDCYWKGDSLYDCGKFALYGLSYQGWNGMDFYCGEHLSGAVMDDFNEGVDRFIIVPLYTVSSG